DLTFVFARDNPGVAADVNASFRNAGVLVSNPITSRSLPDSTLAVINVVINGRLLQFPDYDGSSDACPASCPGYARPDDNKIIGNDLRIPNPSRVTGTGGAIFANVLARRTIIRDNEVHEAGQGVRMAGNMPAEPVTRPSHCIAPDGSPTD